MRNSGLVWWVSRRMSILLALEDCVPTISQLCGKQQTFQMKTPSFGAQRRSLSGRFVFADMSSKETSEVHAIDLHDAAARPRCLSPRQPGVLYEVSSAFLLASAYYSRCGRASRGIPLSHLSHGRWDHRGARSTIRQNIYTMSGGPPRRLALHHHQRRRRD